MGKNLEQEIYRNWIYACIFNALPVLDIRIFVKKVLSYTIIMIMYLKC